MLTAMFNFGLGQISLQVNGGAATTAVFAGPISHTASALESLAFSSILTDGRVDEVGLWQRVLTPLEVSTLYNGGAGLSYPF